MVLVYGFGGLRDYNGCLSFHPRLPKTIKRLQFSLTILGQRLEVDINDKSATYLLLKGTELVIKHQGKDSHLSVGIPVSVELKPVVELEGGPIKTDMPPESDDESEGEPIKSQKSV